DPRGFYEHLGWQRWRGPLAGRRNWELVPTPGAGGREGAPAALDAATRHCWAAQHRVAARPLLELNASRPAASRGRRGASDGPVFWSRTPRDRGTHRGDECQRVVVAGGVEAQNARPGLSGRRPGIAPAAALERRPEALRGRPRTFAGASDGA